MADVDRTAVEEAVAVLDRIVLEAGGLKATIETVQCTAICVRLALVAQSAEQDEDIALCVQHHIVDELEDLMAKVGAFVDSVRALLIPKSSLRMRLEPSGNPN